MINLKKFNTVYFKEDSLPYEIKAIDDNYVVVSRTLDFDEDYSILENKVEMSAYLNIDEAFNDLKDSPIYSIIDLKNSVRGSDNLVFGIIDYFDKDSCLECLKKLNNGGIGLSKRTTIPLNIDIRKTIEENSKNLSYEECIELSLGVRWKTSNCSEGKICWCRIIEPEISIISKDDEEIYIAGSGCIPQKYAEHIVKIHNENLK